MLHWINCYTFHPSCLNSANGQVQNIKKHVFTGNRGIRESGGKDQMQMRIILKERVIPTPLAARSEYGGSL